MRVISTCLILLADQVAAWTSCNSDCRPNRKGMALGRRVFIAILLAVGLAILACAGGELSGRNVSIIDELSPDSNFSRQFEQTIHSTLDNGMTPHCALYSESLDMSRFNVKHHLRNSKLTDAGGTI